MDIARTSSLVAATITVGLMAGLFAAFSYSVMPGLARTSDRTFVDAMQRINVAIVNGWFLLCFLGALVTSVLAAVLHLGSGSVFWLTAAGAVLYIATLAITARRNVPLNNALDAAGPDTPSQTRAAFEAPWVRWNLVRTATSVAAFLALAAALTAA